MRSPVPSPGSAARTTVVLVNSELIGTLRFVGLPSVPFWRLILAALRLSFCLVPELRGAATGNPGAPPPTGPSATLRETTETHPGRSIPVGLVMRGLERLAVQRLPRPTRQVLGWHRKGFRLFWTGKIRRGQRGRPALPKDIRELIRTRSRENPLGGAPRLHSELRKTASATAERGASFTGRPILIAVLFWPPS